MYSTYFKVVMGTARPRFLILVPVCLIAAFTAIWYDGNEVGISIFNLSIVTIAALCAHICVNMLNEYFDFKSGLDFTTTKTPFSGGSGTLQKYPDHSATVLVVASIFAAIVLISGLFLISNRGMVIVPYLVIGLLLVILYTPVIVRFPVLCFLAPGLGFGVIMVNGIYSMLTGLFSFTSLFLSLIIFFLVSNLLLLNQFPDVESDSRIGRKTMPVKFGIKISTYVFMLSFLCSIVIITMGIIFKIFPLSSVISTIPLSIGVLIGGKILKYQQSLQHIIPLMGINVAITVITPLIISFSLLLSK